MADKPVLPKEYTPLTFEQLPVGSEFGPITFSVSEISHSKTIQLHNENLLKGSSAVLDVLLPSEMWSWARVLSPRFGRLNEVLLAKSCWELYGTATPGEEMTGRTGVIKQEIRKDLRYVTTVTDTKNASGKLLMRCVEDVLLLHDAPPMFYTERPIVDELHGPCVHECARRVYFRFDWNNGHWLNNIHVDGYARTLGYERGLPEFIMYMDWMFLSALTVYGDAFWQSGMITIKKILPVYAGDVVRILVNRDHDKHVVRFLRDDQVRLVADITIA